MQRLGAGIITRNVDAEMLLLPKLADDHASRLWKIENEDHATADATA